MIKNVKQIWPAFNLLRKARRFIIIILPLLLFIQPLQSEGQIVLNEIHSEGGTIFAVEIKNQGAAMVNIGGYFLCHFPSYEPLISLSLVCGSLNLPGGEIVVVTGFSGGTAADGELGLYLNGNFGNPGSIVDYVEWGSSGHTRSTVAQAAGIWSMGDFVPGFSPNQSIEYSGTGNTSASWELEALLSSLCDENPPGENCNIIAGTISTADPVNVCSGDGIANAIDVQVSGANGENEAWLITDLAANILDVPDNPPFDFEGATSGTCLIWHVTYDGELTGAEVGLNAGDLQGCYEISNSISIVRTEVAGGSISTANETSVCTGDGMADSINVSLSDTIGENSAWIITDTSLNILSLPAGPPFDFDEAGPGVCLIWHVSYINGLTGLMEGQNIAGLDGCYDLSNSIEVNRIEPDGGTITTSDDLNICLLDLEADTIHVELSGERGGNSAWVITDTTGLILELPSGPPFTFSGDARVCQIYHLSFEDGLSGLVIPLDVNDLEGCFDLSNPITVIKSKPAGGTISATSTTTFCIGENEGDTVEVSLEGQSGANQQWMIVDIGGTILELPEGPPFSFDAYGPGTYVVFHLSYADGLTGLTLNESTTGLMGCFNLSNPIIVTREQPQGGTISTADATEVCTGDGQADSIDVVLDGEIGDNSNWIITDEDLNILDLPAGPPFDFEGADSGTCLIWHVSYSDGLAGLTVGLNLADLQGCFGLSNSIAVVRTHVDGGIISTMDNISICVDDTIADLIDVMLVDEFGGNIAWIITDTSGNILDLPTGPPFDFSAAGLGVSEIWSISYEDGLTGLGIGQNIGNLSGCYSFSNVITVDRNTSPLSAMIMLQDSTFATEICAGDGVPDPFNVLVEGDTFQNATWIITDVQGVILALPPGPPFDLEGAGPGTCLLWHINQQGSLGGASVGLNIADLMGCFALSNFIEVHRMGVNGGTISTSDATTLCVGDANPDLVNVLLEDETGENTSWIITDASGVILDLPNGPPFDFDGAGPGVCSIWHIGYAEFTVGLQVDLNINDIDGCFDLSNSIEITRDTSGAVCENVGVFNSIEDLVLAEVYPNPVGEYVHLKIQFSEAPGDLTVQIINILGELVLVNSFAVSNNFDESFSLQGIPAGQYMIKVTTEQGTLARPFIKLN